MQIDNHAQKLLSMNWSKDDRTREGYISHKRVEVEWWIWYQHPSEKSYLKLKQLRLWIPLHLKAPDRQTGKQMFGTSWLIPTNSTHLRGIKILPILDHWSAFPVGLRQQCCLLCMECFFIISDNFSNLLGTMDKSVQSWPNADSSESWIWHHHALHAMSRGIHCSWTRHTHFQYTEITWWCTLVLIK